MRLMHNLNSLNIYREQNKVVSRQSAALRRISSGYKINSAKENPNAIASSEKMRIQIRGLQMAQRNAQDGVSMLQTADGALDNITSMLQRIRELTVQAGNDSATIEDKKVIQEEINNLKQGIGDIIKNTQFNGVELLKGNKILKMPIGANVGESVEIPISDLSPDKIGLDSIDVTTNTIDDNLDKIDEILDTVISKRSKYGALLNRFESAYDKTGEIHDIIVGAESQIRDADVAEEIMNFSRDNILIEAGNAMMVQSNKFPQEILRILENVKAK